MSTTDRWPNGGTGALPKSPASTEIRPLIEGHRVTDERERRSREQFLEELARLDDPCNEAADPVHVTASSVIVGPRGTILHLHRRLHRWMQPGGHVDRGEQPPEAALRESEEETGLALAHPPGGPCLIHLDVHPAASGHTHLDLRYLLVGPDEDPAPPPGESQDVRWFAWDVAEKMADESLAGALRVARRLAPSLPLGASGDGRG